MMIKNKAKIEKQQQNQLMLKTKNQMEFANHSETERKRIYLQKRNAFYVASNVFNPSIAF
jgi:hypothetical protein